MEGACTIIEPFTLDYPLLQDFCQNFKTFARQQDFERRLTGAGTGAGVGTCSSLRPVGAGACSGEELSVNLGQGG